MPHSYYDIRQQIQKPPIWYDSNGVPRYCRFHPRRIPDYLPYEPDEVVLFEIGCQGCRKVLRVEEHFSRWKDGKERGLRSLRTSIRKKKLYYGDPPGHTTPYGKECGDCCMSSIPLKVLQFWRRQSPPNRKRIDFMWWLRNEWVRVPELEGLDIEGPWGLYPLYPGPTKSRYWTARGRDAHPGLFGKVNKQPEDRRRLNAR